jgi:hypothetical protein
MSKTGDNTYSKQFANWIVFGFLYYFMIRGFFAFIDDITNVTYYSIFIAITTVIILIYLIKFIKTNNGGL